jgi:hypothetical protein
MTNNTNEKNKNDPLLRSRLKQKLEEGYDINIKTKTRS